MSLLGGAALLSLGSCGEVDGSSVDAAAVDAAIVDGDDVDAVPGDAGIDAALCGAMTSTAAPSCLWIRDNCGAVSSGRYFLDTLDGVTQVECDMTTDGGGWTEVFFASMSDFTTAPAYNLRPDRLRTAPTHVLVGLRTSTRAVLAGWWRTALPSPWLTSSPFAVDEQTISDVRLTFEGGDSADVTLYYGQNGWNGDCGANMSAWIPGGGNGRICQTDSRGIGYTMWARNIQDQCGFGGPSTPCGAERRFSIYVR